MPPACFIFGGTYFTIRGYTMKDDGIKRWKIQETIHFTVEFIIAEDGELEDFKLTRKWSTQHKNQEWSPSDRYKSLENKAKKKAKKTVVELDAEASGEVTL